MIARLGSLCSRIAQQIMPDPFIFALLLTLLTLFLGVLLTPSTPGQMVQHWLGGFWDLLAFGMQMVLILITGGVLAQSPPVRRIIDVLVRIPRSSSGAIVLVSLLAMTTALINWGLGLIVGALSAREAARSLQERNISVHYPLIGAAGYTGLLIWHSGLSGSAPLTVATADHFLVKMTGVIPVTSTIFSGMNLFILALLLISVPLFLKWMLPRDASTWIKIPVSKPQSEPETELPTKRTLAVILDESRLLTV
ncbi:MAG: TIGR00366 family protein, partial [bacterium]